MEKGESTVEFIPRLRVRSALRSKLGGYYYRGRRYLRWAFSFQNNVAAPNGNENLLQHLAFEYSTPLYRNLDRDSNWLQQNKAVNLGKAIPRLNRVVIFPGQRFSFWRLVGRPTKSRGFLPGMVLSNGRVIPGIGGGLCQLSNLIYWMSLHTPLQTVERWRHNYDVFPDSDRTQPFGSGATVVYNYIDLQLINATDQSFQLLLWLTPTHLHGQFRSEKAPDFTYELYEKAHLIQQQPWGGYTRHNQIYRRVYNLQHDLVGDEFVAANHAIMMYNPALP